MSRMVRNGRVPSTAIISANIWLACTLGTSPNTLESLPLTFGLRSARIVLLTMLSHGRLSIFVKIYHLSEESRL